MDLIDREQLMNYIRSRKINIGKLAHDVIMKQPSIQPQEPKTGHWIVWNTDSYDWTYKCDKCERIALKDSNYCPNCGAKMEREDKR